MKLLISCRDVGAAGHLKEVFLKALNRPHLELAVLASSPAYEYLIAANIPAQKFSAQSTRSLNHPNTEFLLEKARQALEFCSPDALLTGLSGMDAGIDEALLRLAKGKIPTFAFQDSWGDLNLRLEASADTYLVLDSLAERLTRDRGDYATHIVGAPKYSGYQRLTPSASNRERIRIGYFGQPLHELVASSGDPVSLFTARCLVDQLLRFQDLSFEVVYRPHPREEHTDRIHIESEFSRLRERYLGVPDGSIESVLSKCHVVISCFSTVCFDYTMLQHYAEKPLGASLYLLLDSALTIFHRGVAGIELPPPALEGSIPAVQSVDQLENALRLACSEEEAQRQWEWAKSLSPPHHAADAILDIVVGATRRGV